MNIKSDRVDEFLDYVNERFGIYLDSLQGYECNYQQMLHRQASVQKHLKVSIEELDNRAFIRSNFDPPSDLEEASKLIKHSMTQGQYKKNNQKGGLNGVVALDDCLCAIFNRWDEFRIHILKKKGAANRNIMPLLDYLGQIRDRLTHHKNYSLSNHPPIASLKLQYVQYTLPSFMSDQAIQLTEKDLDAIVDELRAWIIDLING